MANYPIPDAPEYNPNVRALENTDRGNAQAVFNPTLGLMVTNTHAVKLDADAAKEAASAAQNTADAAKEAAAAAQKAADEAQQGAGDAIPKSEKGKAGGVATYEAAETAKTAAINAQAAANIADANAVAARTYKFNKASVARPTSTLGGLASTVFGDSALSGYYYTTHTPTLPPGVVLDDSYMPFAAPWPSAANIKVCASGKACTSAWYEGKLYLAFEAQPTGAMLIDYSLVRDWGA